ncbi:gliding motility-associated lipoprotein GldH [Echinicola strongylocentroti]|uniref:Gliding motility-associated lipoprotein GldH n=1 Tax=Echinicola strongylocentroti TaxID=1795355 RepID=A0A2Z4IGV7_9BACT|nr:gliding motility lipoprotein GldH [Echinicola strongylocentroti]AWW29959.1 gliding motility-associated lipoprotein GldH [Echinicola strongylocentroti]
MKIRSMANNLCSSLFGIFLLFSCNNNRIYEEHQGLEKLSWPIADTVSFDIDIASGQKTLSTLRIKYNQEYDYYNLYVRYLVRDSLGQIVDNELLDMNLFDPKTGKPLGSGYGNSFTQIDTLDLQEVSQYQKLQVQFVQYMRSNDLDGIESVGIKLEKE